MVIGGVHDCCMATGVSYQKPWRDAVGQIGYRNRPTLSHIQKSDMHYEPNCNGCKASGVARTVTLSEQTNLCCLLHPTKVILGALELVFT